MTRLLISVMSSIAKRIPSRPSPLSFTPPYGMLSTRHDGTSPGTRLSSRSASRTIRHRDIAPGFALSRPSHLDRSPIRRFQCPAPSNGLGIGSRSWAGFPDRKLPRRVRPLPHESIWRQGLSDSLRDYGTANCCRSIVRRGACRLKRGGTMLQARRLTS